MVKSKYSVVQFIAIGLSCGLFFVLPVIIMNIDGPDKAKFVMRIMPIFGLFLLYFYFKSGPRILFDDEFVTAKYPFQKKMYSWSAIRDIYLSNKENYFLQNMEATSIIFEDGQKIRIWEDIYTNCDQMRELLSKKAPDKIRDPRPHIIPGNLNVISRRRYSGNVYTSFNTLLILGLSLFMAFPLWGKMSSGRLIFIPILFIGFLFFGLGTQMNYFLIDEGYLIIKNHYFAWINRRVSLQDIEEVDIEQPNKRSTGLRVITRDFKSKLYGAGSLRDRNWDELMKDLKTIGIPARDDR